MVSTKTDRPSWSHTGAAVRIHPNKYLKQEKENTRRQVQTHGYRCLSDRMQLQLSAQPNRHISSVTTLISKPSWHKRCEALQVEPNKDNGSGSTDLPLRLRLQTPWVAQECWSAGRQEGFTERKLERWHKTTPTRKCERSIEAAAEWHDTSPELQLCFEIGIYLH